MKWKSLRNISLLIPYLVTSNQILVSISRLKLILMGLSLAKHFTTYLYFWMFILQKGKSKAALKKRLNIRFLGFKCLISRLCQYYFRQEWIMFSCRLTDCLSSDQKEKNEWEIILKVRLYSKLDDRFYAKLVDPNPNLL